MYSYCYNINPLFYIRLNAFINQQKAPQKNTRKVTKDYIFKT